MKYFWHQKIKNHIFTITADETSVLELKFGKIEPDGAEYQKTPIIQNTIKELEEYFDGNRQDFDIKLAPQGTEFQKLVWNNLRKIPYGQTISYKQLAEMAGNPKASRAVGMANNKNPIAIIVPCHRVIGSNGNLTGYAGGLDLKKELLELEKNNL